MPRRKVAGQREILAMYTAVMRGELTDWAVRRQGGEETLSPVPPKISDRMHAAQLLEKHLPAARTDDTAAAEEIARLLQSLEVRP